MMEKKVEPLELKVGDNGVSISQDYYDDPTVINVPFDQIDLLIQWLQEAKAELSAKRKATAPTLVKG